MASKIESQTKSSFTKDGYQPLEKGYQPTTGVLSNSNPPKGGSGMSSGAANGGNQSTAANTSNNKK
jgi:hypothetical protein